MNREAASQAVPITPFDKFQELTKRLLAVPKQEIDEQAAEEGRQKQARKKTTESK